MNIFGKKCVQKIASLILIFMACINQVFEAKPNNQLDSINAVMAQSAQAQKQLVEAARITNEEKEALSKKYANLLSEHKACEERLDSYKKECRVLEDSISTIKKDMQSKLTQMNAMVESTQKELKKIASERDQSINKYERECALLRENKEKLAAQCTELREQIKNQVPGLNKELKNVQHELAQKTNALTAITEKYNKISKILDEKNKECAMQSQRVNELMAAARGIEQKMASMSSMMEKKNAELASQQARADETASRLTKLAHDATQERDALALKCKKLSTEYASFQEKTQKHTEQSKNNFEKKIAELSNTIEKKTAELMASRTRADEISTQLTQVQHQAKEEQTKLQNTHKALMTECAGLKKEIAHVNNEKSRTAAQLVALEQKYSTKQKELSDQLKNSQTALKESTHLCQTLEKSLAKTTGHLNERVTREATLSKELDMCRANEKKMNAQLALFKEQQEREREALVAQITEQQDIIHQAKAQHSGANQTIQELQAMNQQLKNSMNATREKLCVAQREYAEHIGSHNELMKKMDALCKENSMIRTSYERAQQTKQAMHQELRAQLNEHKLQCKSLEKQNMLLQKELELASNSESGMQCALSEKLASLIKEHENFKKQVAAERIKRQQVIAAAKKTEQIKLKTPLQQTLDKKCVQMQQEKKVRQVVAQKTQNQAKAVAKTAVVKKKQQPKSQASAAYKRRSLFGGRVSKEVSKN